MDYTDIKRRLLAAQTLMLEPSSSFEKFHAVKKLLAGVSPQLDAALNRCEQDLQPIEQVLGKDFFGFAAENLPEATQEQKNRKKYVVLFWKTWNTLRREVSRVQAEIENAQHAPDEVEKASHIGRIFNFAKGPFGVLTIVAVGLVSVSAYTSVDITIHNQGCPTMIPSGGLPFPIPGIVLPKDPIPDGGRAEAALPGLPFNVDATQKGLLTAKVLTFTMSFQLGDVDDITLDGESLSGKASTINLGSKKAHDLVFICN